MIASLLWLRQRIALQKWRARFPQTVIHPGAIITSDSTLGAHAVLFPGASLQGAHLGAFSYAQARTQINNAQIGAFCSIASDVVIGLAAHPVTMVSTSPVFYDPKQPLPKFLTSECLFDSNLPRTVVGADVWIGQRALIRSGVTIGVGSVVGAGAVVTRDVAPYSIVGGVPARMIRQRFDDEICRQLLQSRWWELELAALVELAPHFRDPNLLLRALQAPR